MLLCVSFGAFLIYYHDADGLDPFRSSFLAMSFAVATFYVSFAIGGFNSSAYRPFHRAFPPRLLWFCVIFIVTGLLPLAILVVLPFLFIRACLLLLPLLAVAGAGLLETARRETDIVTLLDRLCSVRLAKRHFESLVPQIDAKIAETKELILPGTGGQPTHEYDWHLPLPTQQDGPLNSLATLGMLAIESGDHYGFARVINRSLEIYDLAETFEPQETVAGSYAIQKELRSVVFEALQRMMLALQRDNGTASLTRVAIDALAELTVTKAKMQKQTQNITFSAIQLMESLGLHCYECGSKAEIRVPLIVSRQIVQRGMENPPPVQEGAKQSIEVLDFNFSLPHLSDPIKRLGSFGITKRDSHLLYQCLDAFGWLGCLAVKHKRMQVTTACLRALSQLGREARAAGIECHWDKCAVRPEDHAAERIDWIASWVGQVSEDCRTSWIGLLDTAYSRLYGKETTLTIVTGEDGRPSTRKNVSEKNHVERYVLLAGSRGVDYSDFTFLKDLELRGGKGIVMQGPLMPLTTTTSDKSGATTDE
jgi:hypothetical protein